VAKRGLSIELACAGAIVGITLWQVLVPPFVGLADNGDFGKVAGRFSLVQPGGIFDQHFIYVVGKYAYDPRIYWNSGIITSEVAPVGLAVFAHWIWNSRSLFDIRYLGVMHVAIVALALWLMSPALAWLPRAARAITGGLLVLALTDISYVSYWNSFYTDAAALAFLVLAAACGVRMVLAPTTANTVWFGIAELLLVTSKLQHALPAMVFCVYLVWAMRRTTAWVLAVAGVAAMVVLSVTSPAFYREKAMFNLIFYEYAPKSPEPNRALRELGLDDRYAVALGLHAFSPKYPANDPGWLEEFDKRASLGPIIRYYLRHPGEVARHLKEVLTVNVPEMRAPNLGNFRVQDRVPPGTLSKQWSFWSTAEARLFARAPIAPVGMYLVAIAVAIACRRRFGAPADLMLAFVAFGIAEFAGASLGDVLDTGRHLRLFHAATDLLTIGTLMGAALLIADRKAKRRIHPVV
jgi:hypothetical protein